MKRGEERETRSEREDSERERDSKIERQKGEEKVVINVRETERKWGKGGGRRRDEERRERK